MGLGHVFVYYLVSVSVDLRVTLGPLRQAFLTRLYQFETDCLSGSINRSVVTPF
jgi:hypothetical protein